MENPTTDTTTRPLRFWIRAVDRGLAREIATALDAAGTTPREWRLLTLLGADAPADAERRARAHRRGGRTVRRLVDRGWIADIDGEWTLTDEGRAAEADLAEVVGGIRARVRGAVSDADYATTLASLEAIARELGVDPEQWMSRDVGHRGFGGPRGRFARHGTHARFGSERGHHGHHEHDRREGFGPRHQRDGDAPRGGAGCGAGHRHTQRAFERGFDAGFARGAASRAA